MTGDSLSIAYDNLIVFSEWFFDKMVVQFKLGNLKSETTSGPLM